MTSGIRNTFKRSALILAVTLGFAGVAQAQQASGNIMGEAVIGDTVVVVNEAIGLRRELHIKKDGKYHMSRLPIGTYKVTVKHADGSEEGTKQLLVQTGTTARVK